MPVYQPFGWRQSNLLIAFVDVNCVFCGLQQNKKDEAKKRLLVFMKEYFSITSLSATRSPLSIFRATFSGVEL